MSIEENLKAIQEQIPPGVRLVAVSKTHPIKEIKRVYDAGQRLFAENRVQELATKKPELPPDIHWHLIGHLQTNKVKQAIRLVEVIESVDSEKLIKQIQKEAHQLMKVQEVYLQIRIANEDTKTGMDKDQAEDLLKRRADFPNVHITGLMGIGTLTEDESITRKEFEYLAQTFKEWKDTYHLTQLSMGMSGDFVLAIQCGSTSVRVGSGIFGARDYPAS